MYKLVKLFDKAGVIPEGEKITQIWWKDDGTLDAVETDKAFYDAQKI